MFVSDVFTFISEIEIKASFNVIELLLYEEVKNISKSKYVDNDVIVKNTNNFDLKDFNIFDIISKKDFYEFIKCDEFMEYTSLLKNYCKKFCKIIFYFPNSKFDKGKE